MGSTDYRVWERDLADLTESELRVGLERSKDFTEYFSLPAFRRLCKAVNLEQFGLPSVRAAYEEACLKPSPKDRQRWSHGVVYHAGRLTGWHELQAMPTEKMLPRFTYHYEQLCNRVMAGEDINVDVPQAIPRVIRRVCTKEENIQRMAALRHSVGL